MPMTTSQMLKSMNFTKTQKYQLKKKSNKKNHQLHIKSYFMAKNSFVAEINFKPDPFKRGVQKCDKLHVQIKRLTVRFYHLIVCV